MTEPYYTDGPIALHLGDCRKILPTLADASVDAICTDPPYEIGFMGRGWDATGIAYDVGMWRECLRVLKPGGHLLAFGAPRTYHRLACAIEDAGFEIRDFIDWIYGNGFPKGHDVAKAISAVEALGGANTERLRRLRMGDDYTPSGQQGNRDGIWLRGESGANVRTDPERLRSTPISDAASVWQGWSTALKPAHEPIAVGRKPLDRTVAGNVLQHGTGALNIDACRVEAGQDYRDKCASVVGLDSNRNGATLGSWTGARQDSAHDAGRWPTNIVFTHLADCELIGERIIPGDSRAGQEAGQRPSSFVDVGADSGDPRPNGTLYGSQTVPVYHCAPGCSVAELDSQSGKTQAKASWRGTRTGSVYNAPTGPDTLRGHNDAGGASRFFPVFRYEPKAPASERPRLEDGTVHTTVKPLDLMRWLVRLITPPGGTVLDHFAGSGTTLEACIIEGFHAIGIEKDPKHAELCVTRLSKPIQPTLDGAA